MDLIALLNTVCKGSKRWIYRRIYLLIALFSQRNFAAWVDNISSESYWTTQLKVCCFIYGYSWIQKCCALKIFLSHYILRCMSYFINVPSSYFLYSHQIGLFSNGEWSYLCILWQSLHGNEFWREYIQSKIWFSIFLKVHLHLRTNTHNVYIFIRRSYWL